MRNRFFLVLDVMAAALVVIAAFSARFEGLGWWYDDFRALALTYAAVVVPLKIAVFWRAGLYSRLWAYASISDLEVMIACGALGAAVSLGIGILALPLLHLTPARVPVGIVVIDSLLMAAAIAFPRLSLRMIARRMRSRGHPVLGRPNRRITDTRRVLIVGAGNAGVMIAKELLDNPQLGMIPLGFLDDDTTKHGHRLNGLIVFGAIERLEETVRSYAIDEVITALPSARGKVIRDIMQRTSDAGVSNRTVPGLYEILSGAKAVSLLRPIQIEDLLRRDPIETNLYEVSKLAQGQTVLVTGAGGSIGRELCRQIARVGPAQIIALGRGENSIFELLEEMRTTYPDIVVNPMIVDVRDEVRLRAVFEQTRPFSVFHAAAHKHVPLMECSIDEAILNNVLGTRNVAELCAEFGVEHLVLISTDKAVRPTSVMGATKRIAESIVHAIARRTDRPYVAVRFGNVLGSRGSVVPTFLRQIAAGGPITITHPEMRRYFMTIPEAVQLVLQAGAQGKGGEVFVLDMGDPVRIADLAEDLVRLSGLELESDIEIAYTGLRPGEKLYEELFFGPDDATPTAHPKILQARDGNESDKLDFDVENLIDAARFRAGEDELRMMIKQLVPEYQPPAKSGGASAERDTPAAYERLA